MREIKFRGKTLARKWLYGSLRVLGGKYAGISCNRDDGSSFYGRVKADTVGQYTGMKDCDGTEIYEGDIVSTDDEDEELAIIKWGDDTLKFVVTHGNVYSDLGEYYPREIEVIGNIYDNPELLGGAHDEH